MVAKGIGCAGGGRPGHGMPLACMRHSYHALRLASSRAHVQRMQRRVGDRPLTATLKPYVASLALRLRRHPGLMLRFLSGGRDIAVWCKAQNPPRKHERAGRQGSARLTRWRQQGCGRRSTSTSTIQGSNILQASSAERQS